MKNHRNHAAQLHLDLAEHEHETGLHKDGEIMANEVPRLSIHLYDNHIKSFSKKSVREPSSIYRARSSFEHSPLHIYRNSSKPRQDAKQDAKQEPKQGLQHHREASIKLVMAKQLMDWMIQDELDLEELSEKTLLPLDKLSYLLGGNLGKLHFYELLTALTQFGYQAYICLRPTQNSMPGHIELERI